MTIRDELHELVDQVDEEAAREALACLQPVRLPAFLCEALLADEPETEVERAAVASIQHEA